MDILQSSYHHIDYSEGQVEKIDIEEAGGQLKKYIRDLVLKIYEDKTKQVYIFERESSETKSLIESAFIADFDNHGENLAKKLLQSEIVASKRSANLNHSIQKGSLFFTFFKAENESNYVLLCKAEHSEILDESEFTTRKGPSWKITVYKAFMAKLDSLGKLDEVFIFDKVVPQSKYWWRDFLDLTPKHSDKFNTQESLNAIDSQVLTIVKKVSERDYFELKNKMVGYYRSRSIFKYDEFSDMLFSDFEPKRKDLPIDRAKSQLDKIFSRGNFDTQFPISQKDINKRRITQKVQLNKETELVFSDYSKFDEFITPDFDSNGKKVIIIQTEKGHDFFKK